MEFGRFILGTSIVKCFALTLIIGVLVSMFTAITVTKNFMHLLFGAGQLKHPSWFGIKESEIGKAYEATETKKEKANTLNGCERDPHPQRG